MTQDIFFDSINRISEDPSLDHPYFDDLKVLKGISRTTYQCLYLIDYYKRTFEFASENRLFLCGYTAKEFMQMGYDFYLKHTPKEDLELLLYINKIGGEFYAQLSIEERTEMSITYDFHITQPNGKMVLVNHHYTPIALTQEGKIWKALCLFSLSHNASAGNIKIMQNNKPYFWEFNDSTKKWSKTEKISLTDREKDIIVLSAQGYDSKAIANHLCLQESTIKYHRHKLYQKMKVKSLAEALSYAITNQLI